ncbi:phytoene desaturase family protein [Paenibacillus gansuensis]|uniref:Phytoene desaturase family protein n=1 Tax=Paenibacillus gansuensis TaxID=306542 RepID=A0ABW5P8D1_9BACL
MDTTYDVAVVGGGIAGLTAAIYAAKAGQRTIVLEQQQRLGGRAVTNEKEGVYFNLGAHALFKGEAYETFKELGVRLEGSQPDVNAYGIWKKELCLMPMSLSSLVQSPLLSWKGKMEFGKWFAKLGTADTSKWNRISVRDWVEHELSDPMLRNLFYSLLRTASYAMAPELQTAGPVLKQLQRSLKGVFYVDRGWGSIVEQLRGIALSHGVECAVGWKASSVEQENGRVRSVTNAEGTRIPAANIIITAPPAAACKLIADSEQTALHRWAKQAVPVTAACLDVGLRSLPKPDHNFIYGLDQPVFLTDQSRSGKPRSAVMSEDGTHSVSLLKYQGPQPDAKRDELDLEAVLDLAQPGWRELTAARQYLPKMTVVHDFPHMNRTELPGPAVPEIQGLYVAGDWVSHGELLVDASAASAKRAVQHLVQGKQAVIA